MFGYMVEVHRFKHLGLVTHAPWSNESQNTGCFSFSPSRMCKLIGFKFNSKMQAMFCGRILPSLYTVVFLVVTSFAKTECYSPSNLLVRSVTYRTSAMYQLSTCQKLYVASLHAFHDHFSHKTYKHHTSTVTCSKRELKNPPGQNDRSRQKQTTRWK